MEEHKFYWTAIDDALALRPIENAVCIVCMECPNETDWHLQIANWYLEGAELDIMDKDGKNHVFRIKKDGFYHVQETSAMPRVYLMHGVKFWTVLPKPKVKPDDILTIE